MNPIAIADQEFRPAAVAAETLAMRAYDNAVGLSYYGVAQANEFFRIAEDCAAREDYVGAWQAYAGAYLVVEDNQRFSLLKKDADGRTV